MPRHYEKDRDKRLDFMTQEEISMIDDFLTKIEQNRSFMDQEYYGDWEEIEEVYAMQQPIIENRPNSRVNILTANIEGQVTALVEQNLSVVTKGEGPSDQPFAKWARVGLDWTLRKNHIKRILDIHERRREKFGAGWLKLHFDPDAIDGYGLVTVTSPPLNSVFVDMKVRDPLQLEEAEYIAEVMEKSKAWAKEHFGDVAENINYGGTDKSLIFTKEKTTDDEDIFWYVQLWTKTDDKLRLIEFSDDGVLLDDSFKEWDGKKFKELKKPEPFHRYNKYPYFLTNVYQEEGKLVGFGDGRLLRPLQEMINDLYDQIRRAARPNRVFFDEASEVDLEDLDTDDGPVPCNDPNHNIRVVEIGKVNPALWQLLASIHEEVQRVTRFSELMMGQQGRTKTATEAVVQQQQGSNAVEHKKLMLEATLIEISEYMLDMMIENYEGGKFFRLDENIEDYLWIDFRQLDNVPVLIPAASAFINEFKAQNPDSEIPKWEQLNDDDGKPATKSVDLDIEISIGAGLPKNKAFIYQMMDALANMIVEGKNVISWQEFRKFAKDFLGLPLENDQMTLQAIMQAQVEQAELEARRRQQERAELPSATTEGLTQAEQPDQGMLPTSPEEERGAMLG